MIGDSKEVDQSTPLNSNIGTPSTAAQNESDNDEIKNPSVEHCIETVYQSDPTKSRLVSLWIRKHKLEQKAIAYKAGNAPEDDFKWSRKWLQEYDKVGEDLQKATRDFISCQVLFRKRAGWYHFAAGMSGNSTAALAKISDIEAKNYSSMEVAGKSGASQQRSQNSEEK